MKFILSQLLLLVTISASAKEITLNNNNPTPGQYTTFLAAYNAASAGDTILVQASPETYSMPDPSSFTIEKKITIIGQGHKLSQNAGVSVKFSWIYLKDGFSKFSISGCEFVYIRINNGLPLAYSDTILIENCKYTQYVEIRQDSDIKLLHIRNSISPWIILNNSNTQVIIENCFIGNVESYGPGLTYWGGSGAKMVKNCLIMWDYSYPAGIFDQINNTNFVNNIFFGVNTAPANPAFMTNCFFSNNLSYGVSGYQLPPAGQGGINNLVNVDPLFVELPCFPSTCRFNYNYNYRLQPNSPAKGAGLNGTDIGLYEPGNIFPMTGEPKRPQTTFITPNPVIVPQGGAINVNCLIRKSVQDID